MFKIALQNSLILVTKYTNSFYNDQYLMVARVARLLCNQHQVLVKHNVHNKIITHEYPMTAMTVILCLQSNISEKNKTFL